jgi:HEAT repeats/HEAT repeat
MLAVRDLRRFLTRRWLLAYLGGAALIFGLSMLHPYPRQSLFGPTIRGKPWCYWENEIRFQATCHRLPAKKRGAWGEKIRDWLGFREDPGGLDKWVEHPEMLPLLLKLATDDDEDVRAVAISAIVEYESHYQEPALPILRREMRGGDGFLETIYGPGVLPICAARGVWRITKDKDEVLPTVREALNTPREKWLQHPSRRTRLRCEATSVLGEIAAENPELIPEVLRHAKDEDEGVRNATMAAIASFGTRAIPTLIDGLGDPDKYVRARAADSLQAIGPDARAAIPALDGLLTEPDRDLKKRIIKSLIAIDPARREPLERLWFEVE